MNKNLYIIHSSIYLSLLIFIINIKILEAYQEINISINETGKQQIVYENIAYKPNKILINGILQNYTDYYVYNLNKNISVITLIWDDKLKSCNKMFCELNNIVDINFSNFDTSQVEDMRNMFDNLYSLKSLDVSNFNTSSVKFMNYMFCGCTSLVSLNLNNFDISKVINMNSMFYNLKSIKNLDLNNFKTSSVKHIQYMF